MPRPLHLIARYFYSIVVAILLLVAGVETLFRHHLEWENAYAPAARALANGSDLYSVLLYTYPPFAAFLNVPLIFLPDRLARLILFLAASVCLIYVVVKAWKISGGKNLQGERVAPGSEHFIFILGLLCGIFYLLNVMMRLQTDLFIAALLMAGIGEIIAGRYLRSAVWIGLSAAFKVTPILFAPYLLWRRQWLASAALLAVAIGVNLAPNLIHQPPGGGLWLTQWFNQYVRPISRPDYNPGDWHNATFSNNQSVAGAVRRWFTVSIRTASYANPSLNPSLRGNVPAVRATLFFAEVIILLPVAILLWLRRHGSSPHQLTIECGIIILLMLIFSPMTSHTHFGVMILPAFCIARWVYERRDYAVGIPFALAVLCGMLSIRIGATGPISQFLSWLGVSLFEAIFLLWASMAILFRERWPQWRSIPVIPKTSHPHN